MRKIRIDLGISIEFGPMTIYSRSELDELKSNGHNCAIGRIRYAMVDGEDAPDGVLIYIKPACYGDEPRDIYEYFKTSKAFPHESTTTSSFPNRSSKAIACLGCTRWRSSARQCTGDFREFVRRILSDHLDEAAPLWLETVIGTAE